MGESVLLDILLIALLIGYLAYGFSAGLARSLGGILGVIAGVVVAFFAIPLATDALPNALLRIAATIFLAVFLIGLGHAVGAAIGRGIRKSISKTPLRPVDQLLGGAVTLVAASLVASVVAVSVGSLGIPAFSRAVAGSLVIRTIDRLTPDPVQSWLAEARSFAFEQALPQLADEFGGGGQDAAVPEAPSGTGLQQAAASVVRVSGTAYLCGQTKTGTGFVVAADRIVTNAHVVAGIDEAVVEVPNGQVLGGSVVYFDPIDDLAVIAVDDLSVPPIDLADTLATGQTGAVQGYPFGGPFTQSGADVLSVDTTTVPDIYEQSTNPREVYTLASTVREGNSGGPLLTAEGDVAGVVFARSLTDGRIGYAMTMAELDPVAESAAALGDAVDTGGCTG